MEFNRSRFNKSQLFIRVALNVELSGDGVPDLIYCNLSAWGSEQFTWAIQPLQTSFDSNSFDLQSIDLNLSPELVRELRILFIEVRE